MKGDVHENVTSKKHNKRQQKDKSETEVKLEVQKHKKQKK